jgi:hypothetical protein
MDLLQSRRDDRSPAKPAVGERIRRPQRKWDSNIQNWKMAVLEFIRLTESIRVRYTATNPDRISDKSRECRFFLLKMAEYEREMDIEKFLYCLSAFLSAFRTAIYRSCGVAKTRKGNAAGRKFLQDLYQNAEIKFLKDTTDLEVHGDGAKVWQHYRITLVQVPSRWSQPIDRGRDRFRSRTSRFGQNIEDLVRREPAGWQFEGQPKNLIELCHDALEELEHAITSMLHT